MGKSKRVRKADEKALRDYQRQRKIMLYITIFTGALLVVAAALIPQWGDKAGVVVFVCLALYTAAFFGLRQASKCIYCGQPILWKFSRYTHCPHCKRPIRPSEPGKNTLARK
ncbi:MAG: hypothetical protein IJH38_06940 [Clostridia bacterium]|nr:hypothetical protein [Clostridia bacterium]